jgi:hypothetical protein
MDFIVETILIVGAAVGGWQAKKKVSSPSKDVVRY